MDWKSIRVRLNIALQRLRELRRAPDADSASIHQPGIDTAGLHEDGNTNMTQPQEVSGALPDLPEPEPGFAAWWADLEEAAKQRGVTFTVEQARALYAISTRTPAPIQQKAGESGAEG